MHLCDMLRFAKLEGTGNDFILINDQDASFPSQDLALVRRLCDRHFGVGSDGLILVQAPKEAGTDFHMEFFNPDGSKSFCGNGSRCHKSSDRKSTRLNSSHSLPSRMPSSA